MLVDAQARCLRKRTRSTRRRLRRAPQRERQPTVSPSCPLKHSGGPGNLGKSVTHVYTCIPVYIHIHTCRCVVGPSLMSWVKEISPMLLELVQTRTGKDLRTLFFCSTPTKLSTTYRRRRTNTHVYRVMWDSRNPRAHGIQDFHDTYH